jgi:signal transduction histidine kinase
MDDERYENMVKLVRQIRHDANNPLTAALGHLQLALEDLEGADDEVRTSLATVHSELQRLGEILKRLGDIR